MSNVYYDPEDYGLKIVATMDFSDGGYEFDYLVVWRSVKNNKWYYAEDAGCSCPTPFEDHDLMTLTPVSELGEIISRANHRAEEADTSYFRDAESMRAGLERFVGALKEKWRAAL